MTQWYVYIECRWQCTNRPAYWLDQGYQIALGEAWKEAA